MTSLVQRRVPTRAKQYGNSTDMNNVGLFAMGADDALGLDIVGPNVAWTEMNVAKEGATSVRVTLGRVWKDGKFYANPDAGSQVVPLSTFTPTSTKRIVTIVATGMEEENKPLPRYIKNTVTGAKQSEVVPTEVRRVLTLGGQPGLEAPSPLPPALDPLYIPIANVTMSRDGVDEVQMLTDYQLPNMQGMQARLISLEAYRQVIGTRVETLASDLAVTNDKIGRFNLPALRQGLKRLAELEDRLGIDEGVLLFGYDRFMSEADSDTAHIGYKARIDEGLRVDWAARHTVSAQLLNPNEPRIKTISGWTLPAHDEVLRLDSWGQYQSVNISSYQYANTSFTIFPGPKRRRRYGTSQVHAANSDFWASIQYSVNYLTRTFKTGSENWQITDEWIEGGVTYYRVEQYWDDKLPYWNGYQNINPTAENGYLAAQSFLNAQAGWLTRIGLRFARVDDQHGIRVYVCKVKGGEPDMSEVVATGSVAAGALKASVPGPGIENSVVITPVFLEPGQRYAVCVVSGGDHAISCRNDNELSNGTFFIGDGNTWVADLAKDMNLRLYFAAFTSSYVAFQLQTVTLAGGITDIDVIGTEHTPDGTELFYLIQVDGVWKRLERTVGTHPLAGLPQTLPMMVVMVGTREVMPAMKLGTGTEIRLYRADDDFLHFSEILNAGTNVNTVDVDLSLANWDPAKHTLAVAVLSGANTDAPDVTTDYPQPDGTILRKFTFGLTAPSQTYQIRITYSTTDITDQLVVAHRYQEALPT